MDTPIYDKIVDEIVKLAEEMIIGRGSLADWRLYQQRRSAIIRKYGDTERAFQRARRARIEELFNEMENNPEL
jgi:hypothetical protein